MSQFSSGRRWQRRDWRVAAAALSAVAIVGGAAAVAPHLTGHGAAEHSRQVAFTPGDGISGSYNGTVSTNGQIGPNGQAGAPVYDYSGTGNLATTSLGAPLGNLADNTGVIIKCYWTGAAVTGPNAQGGGTDDFWDQIIGASGTGLPGQQLTPGHTYVVPDAMIDTSPKTVDQIAQPCTPGSGGSGSQGAGSGSQPGGGSGSGVPQFPGSNTGVPIADGTGPCTDIEVVFARGSTETADQFNGLGFPGGYVPVNPGDTPGIGFVPALQLEQQLSGKTMSFYAVPWDSDWSQIHTTQGVDAMESWLTKETARCPSTQFVLGGYSQGAAVVDITLGLGPVLAPVYFTAATAAATTAGAAVGAATGTATGGVPGGAVGAGVGAAAGATVGIPVSAAAYGLLRLYPHLPDSLANRIVAVVTFGNPLDYAHPDYPTVSPLYGPKWKDFCDPGDPVCGSGIDFTAHLSYHLTSNPAHPTQQAADFAATLANGIPQQLNAGG